MRAAYDAAVMRTQTGLSDNSYLKEALFGELSQQVVQQLARRMNKIPRKIFDGKSANEMVKALGLNMLNSFGKCLLSTHHGFDKLLQ